MKVVFHKDFYQVYTSDPAAEAGRMEAIVEVIGSDVEFVTPEPASEAEIAAAHTDTHVDYVRHYDPYYLIERENNEIFSKTLSKEGG
ncbi:MAG: hypothetical protein JRJ38_18505 [Deltaproteobacteria bacterium]|nr:hypothetical protein [Deltaproteobacteria bacterium]